MSDAYLSLDVLGDVVRTKTGIEVDTSLLATHPATISELGIDSLGWLGVISEVENQYGIAIDASAESITTLPELVVIVNGTLTGSDARPGHTDNRVVIGAPLDVVWSMTNDVPTWPQLFSEYSAAVIEHQEGATVRFRLSTQPDENGTVYSWVSERTADPNTWTVRSRRVEPGVFQFMNIVWTYREVDGGVEMRWIQDFAMKPDAPANDEQMTQYINRNSALQMARIKGLVEAAAGQNSPAAAR
jgi:aromatase